jgi:hypothetical protein
MSTLTFTVGVFEAQLIIESPEIGGAFVQKISFSAAYIIQLGIAGL